MTGDSRTLVLPFPFANCLILYRACDLSVHRFPPVNGTKVDHYVLKAGSLSESTDNQTVQELAAKDGHH